jgi:hypothetical protein
MLTFQACSKKNGSTPEPGDRAQGVQPAIPSGAAWLERRGTGRIRYRGLDVAPTGPIRPGDVLELRHYLEGETPLRGDYALLVELRAPGGAVFGADAHRPVGGRVPTSAFRAGEIWIDRHAIRVPAKARGAALEIFVALSEGGERATVEAPAGHNDGKDWLRAATLPLEAGAAEAGDGLSVAVIPRATSTITADGVLDEPAWQQAPVLGFADSLGRGGEIRYPTELRLLWDDRALYVAFKSVDHDISCPFSKRDDPIYDHEAVELFLMPQVIAPAVGPYVELQASPKGIIFDAAFTGRRQGMDTRFDAGQTVATKVDGTLNDPSDQDRGWISEWVVPWGGLRGVDKPPSAQDEWRMNAFRIEKNKQGAEYTAWSPPQVGDFHNTERFGRLRFGR